MWGFFKAIGRGIASVVKTAVNVVKKTVNAVSQAVKKAVNVVTQVTKKVVSFTQKCVDYVSDKINIVKNKIIQVKDKFLNDTWLGKKIKSCSEYISQSFIGRAISYVGDKINQAQKWFFQETVIGKGIAKCKEWLDNTPVGRFINKFEPIISVGLYALGGVGGCLGKFSNFVSNSITTLRNVQNFSPSNLIFNNPIANKLKGFGIQALQKGKSTRLYQNVSSGYQMVKQKLDPYLQPIKNGISKSFQTIKTKSEHFINQYGPSIIYNTQRVMNLTTSLGGNLINKAGALLNPKIQNVINTDTFRKISQYYSPIKKFVVNPARFVVSKTIIPITKYGIKKSNQLYKKTSFYNKYVSLKAMGKVRSSMKNLIKQQKNIPNLSSQNLLQSYLLKYKDLEKVNQKFKIIDKQTQSERKNLNDFVMSNQIKIKKISFNTQRSKQKQSTIQGKLLLENTTNQNISFKIAQGQMFSCTKEKSSQHTVVCGLQGTINKNQEKQFLLDAFCADVSLKWPYGDNNYALTSFKLQSFKNNMDQNTVWNNTH